MQDPTQNKTQHYLSSDVSTVSLGRLNWAELIYSSTSFGVTQITCCPFQYLTKLMFCNVEMMSCWVMLVIWLKRMHGIKQMSQCIFNKAIDPPITQGNQFKTKIYQTYQQATHTRTKLPCHYQTYITSGRFACVSLQLQAHTDWNS